MAELVAVLECPKSIVTACVWSEPRENGQRGLRLRTSLRDSDAAIQGVSLEIVCSAESFERPFRVVILAEFRRKARAMARIDINGSRHVKRYAVCRDSQFIDAGNTHFHDTRLHANITIEELFNTDWDLPVARPIEDMPQDYAKAIERCGQLLNIENLSEIEEPKWQPKRFPF